MEDGGIDPRVAEAAEELHERFCNCGADRHEQEWEKRFQELVEELIAGIPR